MSRRPYKKKRRIPEKDTQSDRHAAIAIARCNIACIAYQQLVTKTERGLPSFWCWSKLERSLSGAPSKQWTGCRSDRPREQKTKTKASGKTLTIYVDLVFVEIICFLDGRVGRPQWLDVDVWIRLTPPLGSRLLLSHTQRTAHHTPHTIHRTPCTTHHAQRNLHHVYFVGRRLYLVSSQRHHQTK